MRSFVPLVKHYFVTMEDDENQFKITCQHCNGFVTYSGRSGELLYINFIHAGFSTIGIHPKDIDPENFYFQWPPRKKMQCLYHKIFKEGNGDQKLLRCPDLREKNLGFCVQKSHWIRSTLSVQKMLKLKLSENIKVLLPNETQSIILANG